MRSSDYNIVLLPESELADKAIRASRELEPLETKFTLGTEANFPHLSLFFVMLDEAGLAEAETRLREIAASAPRISLEANKYSQSHGYISIDYSRTNELDQLQAKVLDAINPLKSGLRANAKKHLQTASGAERQTLEQYGYANVGELFRPHITITRFESREPIPLEDMLAPPHFDGKFVRLALCKLGPNGTCTQKLKEFHLQ